MKVLRIFSKVIFLSVIISCFSCSFELEINRKDNGELTVKDITQNRDMSQYDQGGHILCCHLGDLQMQYVQISRMAEEQLKQKAAQKFSANDILGKK